MSTKKMYTKMGEKGFTLIEMLITAVVVTVIAAAGYTVSTETSKFQARHERVKDMQVRLQSAMEIMTHKIQDAGYGIINPVGLAQAFLAAKNAGLTKPITHENNLKGEVKDGAGNLIADAGSDSLSILSTAEQRLGVLNESIVSVTSAISVIVVPEIAEKKGDLVNLQSQIRLITLGGLSTRGLSQATSTPAIAVDGDSDRVFNFKLNGSTFPNERYPVGFPVEALMGGVTTYTIGQDNGEPALMEDNAVFASGIEDIQVAYILSAPSDGKWVVNTPPSDVAYSALRISLMARVADPNPDWRGGLRPALEDHVASSNPDRYHRATLTRVVGLPNDGF